MRTEVAGVEGRPRSGLSRCLRPGFPHHSEDTHTGFSLFKGAKMGPQGTRVSASFPSVPGAQGPTLPLALPRGRGEEEASKYYLQS